MVYLTGILGYAKKGYKPIRKYLQSGFVDMLRFHVRAGTGGSGLSQYGGVGGRGGDVIVRAKEGVTLKELSQHVKKKELVAGTGFDSSRKGILGVNGEDVIINVPPGVLVFNEENKTIIGEVNKPDETLVVALGGVGGCRETNYSGQRGENHHIILDLKLISDVALVGFPNAGKSTLLSTISNAKPKVAEYPFTTVRPQLGKILYPDMREILIADLPGLIEGAHRNIGKGHSFLKHLERTKLLIFIIDVQGFRLSPKHGWRNALDTVLLLNKEIELYKPELLNLPAMLLLNKMDTKNAQQILDKIKPKLENLDNYKSEFSDDLCPEQTLKFENILTVSLINKDTEEINLIKDTIRTNLDKIQELETLQIEKEMPECKLVRQLKKQLDLNVPILV